MLEEAVVAFDDAVLRGMAEHHKHSVVRDLSAEVLRLRALLVNCRDWLDSPGGDPDSSTLLDRINEALT